MSSDSDGDDDGIDKLLASLGEETLDGVMMEEAGISRAKVCVVDLLLMYVTAVENVCYCE